MWLAQKLDLMPEEKVWHVKRAVHFLNINR